MYKIEWVKLNLKNEKLLQCSLYIRAHNTHTHTHTCTLSVQKELVFSEVFAKV